MAHFVELDENNTVINAVIVHNDELLLDGVENEQKGIDFCVAHLGGRWVQTSYNATRRYNYAGIGYTYDSTRDAFIAPKPFDSWVLNEATCQWQAPIPKPEDGKPYTWNEEAQEWIAAL